MLQSIREHTQGWIAGTIISIIILSFSLWGIHSYFVGGAVNNNVASVNGVDIGKDQLAVAYERLRRQFQAQFGSNSPLPGKNDAALKASALQALIEMEALKQSSLAQGFQISDLQVDNYLQSMPDFQVDGRFSVDRFHEVLSSTLLSTSEFLDLIRTNLLIDQPKLGIMLTSFALPTETKRTIELVNQERDIEYLIIPMQKFVSQPITLEPEKIQAYYDAHKNDYMTPEQVTVEYLELSLDAISQLITPTDAVLKSFYNENINSYTQPMQWKYAEMEIPIAASATQDEIKSSLKTAESLSEAMDTQLADLKKLAATYKATLTISNWQTLNQVPVELQKSVADLTKPGQVSSPFKTPAGIAVIKAIEIKEPTMQLFDAVQDKVKQTYVHQHAEEKFAELRDRLADLTYEHPDSLQVASKELNLPVKISEIFTKEKAASDISQYKKVRETAFSNDVLNLQNNSDVIQINPETVIVVRIKSHIPSTLLPLKNVSRQIQDKLKEEKAETLAADYAMDLKKQLQSGVSSEAIAAQAKLNLSKAGFIGRYSTKVDPAILDLAFRLPNPQVVHQSVTYGVSRLPNGYAIVALKAVKNGDLGDQKQQAVYTEQIQNSLGLLEYELYKQSMVAHAKIKVLQQ